MTVKNAIRSVGYPGLLTLVLSPAGVATTDLANLCLQAAAAASVQTGVPYDVLLAVAVIESGRDRRPWPWTVGIGGEGHWLDTAEAAKARVAQALDEGLTNVDLGCFQINYRWHAEGFTSIADMLDPDRNAAYAADLLAHHEARTGDWPSAAAAYHSATPEHAERYRARFEAVWSGGEGRDAGPLQVVEDRDNGFPLLIAGQSGAPGSLVPRTAGGLRLIGGS